jgi:hypothetical protein
LGVFYFVAIGVPKSRGKSGATEAERKAFIIMRMPCKHYGFSIWRSPHISG